MGSFGTFLKILLKSKIDSTRFFPHVMDFSSFNYKFLLLASACMRYMCTDACM